MKISWTLLIVLQVSIALFSSPIFCQFERIFSNVMTDVEFESGITKIVYLKPGENASLHGGQYKCISYGRIVGRIQGAEVGIKNVTFLFCSPHAPSQCEVFYTNEEGYYAIDLRPSLYRFKFLCPPGYVLSDNITERGCNERDFNYDCKAVPECTCKLPGTIMGKVYNCSDPNRAGLKNKNIVVSITPSYQSTQVDENGNFRFDKLTPDIDYHLTFHNREVNFRFMNPNVTTYLPVQVGILEQNAVIVKDQPVCEFAALHGTVWKDDNANGIRDHGENTPIAGIRVCLYKCDDKGCNKMDLECPKTSQEGTYMFNRLEPGRYAVQFDTAPGATHSVLGVIE